MTFAGNFGLLQVRLKITSLEFKDTDWVTMLGPILLKRIMHRYHNFETFLTKIGANTNVGFMSSSSSSHSSSFTFQSSLQSTVVGFSTRPAGVK